MNVRAAAKGAAIDQFRRLRTALVVGLVMWGAWFGVYVAGLAGPQIEARILPAVRQVEVSAVRWEGERLHWRVRLCKVRPLPFVRAEFDLRLLSPARAVRGDSVPLYRVENVTAGARVGERGRTLSLGCYAIDYAVVPPEGVRAGDVISGTVWYRSTFWRLPQPFGDLTVPARR